MAEQQKLINRNNTIGINKTGSDSEGSSSLRNRLTKLFTSAIIYRPKGKNKTVVIDPSKFQSVGSKSNTRAADKFSRIYRSSQHLDATGVQTGYSNNDFSSIIQSRTVLYSDYEMMDTSGLISSALDIYADESCVSNERGEVVTIKTNDSEIKELLTNLFNDILDVEFNLWSWIRNTVKYGDMYLGLHVQEGFGVVGVVPLSSYFMLRIEGSADNPFNVKYKLINPETLTTSGGLHTVYSRLQQDDDDDFESYEIAHFRLLSDVNFLPYGKSILEGIRKDFKILMLLEDAMLLHRIMRSAEKRVFRVDIGNIPEEEVEAFMESIVSKMKKTPFVDDDTGDYNLRFNIQNMLEDYYIPVRGDNGGTTIDSLPGLEYAPVEDLEYILRKIFAGLKIPKAFLGYDEAVAGKSSLAMEDVRFSRTIDRVQKMIVSELNKIAIVHLFALGIEDERLATFSLSLTNPSIIYEQEKIEMLTQKVTLATSMKELKMISRDFIYKNIFGFDDTEADDEAKKVLDDIRTGWIEGKIESDGKFEEEKPADDTTTDDTTTDTTADTETADTETADDTTADTETADDTTIEDDYDYVDKDSELANKKERERIKQFRKNNNNKPEKKYQDGVTAKGGSPKGGWEGAGRPKSKTKRGTDAHVFGRDVLGKRGAKKAYNDLDTDAMDIL